MDKSTNSQVIQPKLSKSYEAYLIIDGIVHPIQKSPFTIGRSIQNDLVLNDALAAQFHAEIIKNRAHFSIFSTASDAWMTINGERVNTSTLHSGDTIQIGYNAIIFIFKGETLSAKAQRISIKIRKLSEKISAVVLS
ncbi:FHA domain-containing protein [bacterium]|nr:FHA domain-containing protein [bacterium]